MKKHLLFIAAIAASVAISATAKTLTPAEALNRLDHQTPSRIKSAVAGSKPRLIDTGRSGDVTAYYVFATKGGTLIVSADDVAVPLLGYIDRTADNLADMPPQMRWWLGEYADEIAYAVKHSAQTYTLTTPGLETANDNSQSRHAIEPLVATRWDQSAPYNDLCPESNGIKCYTGCVATAMAQAMKYFNWPEKGTGTLSYNWSGSQLTMDLDSTTFEWDNMLDTYSTAAPGTDAEQQAVATLMKACGYSVSMSYGSTSAGSGASPYAIVPALVEHFNYDKATELHIRDFYPLAEWEEMIYDNLASVGPVIYGGESSEGGHCFICDGYDTDGYFHINWGWSGDYDGYFKLSALNPAGQGAGGSAGGYNSGQDAVLGMRRPQARSTYPNPYLALQGTLSGQIENGEIVLSGGYHGGFFNLSSYDGTFDIGLELKNDSTGTITFQTGVTGQTIASLSGLVEMAFAVPTGLADGSYDAYPVYKVNGSDWTPFKIPQSSPTYVKINVDNGTASMGTSGEITVEYFTAPDGFNIGSTSTVVATIDNTYDERREAQITLYLCTLVNSSSLSPVVSYGTETIDIAAHDTSTATFSTEIPTSITSGDYYVVFTDASGNVIGEPTLVNLQLPSGVASIDSDNDSRAVSYFTIQGTAVDSDRPLAPGIYVKVRGGKAEKILVR